MSNKALFLLLAICILAFSCKTKSDEQYRVLSKLINNDSVFARYDDFIVTTTCQCLGCVADKMNNFQKQINATQRKHTLIIIDTNRNKILPYISGSFNYFYCSEDSIEKYYPMIANFILIKKEKDKITLQKAFDDGPHEPDIITFY